MIHHISIAAHDPLHVAQVIAELLDGKVVPFASNPGGYVALAFDAYGTLIEVHPRGTEIRPGIGNAAQHQMNPYPSAYTATHAAISVLASETEIRAIAAREGWRVDRYKRGDAFFEVIEFWVENHLLLELLPPELSAQYLTFFEPRSLKEFLAATS